MLYDLTEPPAEDAVAVADPQGQVPEPFSFSMSSIVPTNLTGGSVKIVDSTVFNVSKQIAVAEVTVNPGGLRELHVSMNITTGPAAELCADVVL
jgi:oxalate decarboxylase/phosphoglucose isomerase-like protein (cupin superfamily)